MGVEKRKSERLAGRFKVVIREKLASWETRTEDVSARGCRIALRRPLTPGALVQVIFDLGPGVLPLVAHGQVAWARRAEPQSAGIAFLSVPRQGTETDGKPTAWIDRLLAAQVRRIDDAPSTAPALRAAPGRARPCPVLVPPCS